MALHLVKICSGCDSPDVLEQHIEAQVRSAGERGHIGVVTRNAPSRVEELLDGGSLYWVMKSKIQARQTIVDIRLFHDRQGTRRCYLVLEPEVIRTNWAAYRPFQGWRYLDDERAPPDAAAPADMPVEMQSELASLGLL